MLRCIRDCYRLAGTGAQLKDLYKEQREMFALFMWKKKKKKKLLEEKKKRLI